MQVVTRVNDLKLPGRGVCVAWGMFDGVHLGHQQLIRAAVNRSRITDSLPMVITFEPHPLAIVYPDRAPLRIQNPQQRLKTLGTLGIEAVLVHPFTLEFSKITGEEYLRTLALELPALRGIFVGQGFHFGYRRSGDFELMERLGRELGFEASALPPVTYQDEAISSSRVRQCIREGNRTAVEAMLGRVHQLEAVVEAGEQLGRKLGFPTANLPVDGLELPPNGVYAVWVEWRGKRLAGVLNLGFRPTLQDARPRRRLEVHLLDFQDDLYGETLTVEWGRKIRDEQRFSGLDTLTAQIKCDVETARTMLTNGRRAID